MTIRIRLGLTAAALLLCAAAPVHDFLAAAIAPDGSKIAAIEGDKNEAGVVAVKHIVLRNADGGGAVTLTMPCGEVRECAPSSLAWAPDARHLTFVLRSPGTHVYAIYNADAASGALTRLAAFNGTLATLKYGPDGRLAALAVAGANKEVGAVEAGAAQTGVLGSDVHEQRIATLDASGKLAFASPANLFVYEYDWRPNGNGFVGTAAPGDGDKNWWVAKLYGFTAQGETEVLYAPTSAQMQLANPVVAPNGKSVVFIGGLMSDFGATGGEAYRLDLASPGSAPVDLTPNWPATVTSLAWRCDGSLLAAQLHADQSQLLTLGTDPLHAMPTPLYSAQQFIGNTPFDANPAGAVSTGCRTDAAATILQSFSQPPEIFAGPIGRWRNVTHANLGTVSPVGQMRSVSWKSDDFSVQGWLLLPRAEAAGAGKKMPMITEVHGGPSWANQPEYAGRATRRMLESGYAVFLPNPRGSYGQGEVFTRGNMRDFGYGDLRDILAGVTAAEAAAPIDENRLGITGWSYGGFMTMWAVTQTNRFHAAVAGAGIANWISYYGENGIDQWMIPFFGASAYDDPKVYEKSSPIAFIKNVRTPTMEVVGENDIECPAPQTEEFWHALDALGVPTQSVIYPGEGHAVRNPAHVADIDNRAVAWFDKYLK